MIHIGNKWKFWFVSGAVFMVIVSAGNASLTVESAVISTFSIAAFDPEMKEFGVAVASRFLAVGSAVPFADSEAGAIATQAWGNTGYGVHGLELLALGVSAKDTVRILTDQDPQKEYRQLGIIDRNGEAAAFTGTSCQTWAGHKIGRYFTVQGNILTGSNVLDAMAEAFENTEGPLAERMLAALAAGQQAGGDSRGKQSAALRVARKAAGYGAQSDVAIDLRVDDHPDPITELGRLLTLHNKTFGMAAWLQSFTAFRDAGDNTAAEACLSRAMNAAENSVDIEPAWLNAVAWTLVEQNRELDRALVLAERALNGEPESAAIIDTVATIHWMKGDRKKAIGMQKRAVEIDPASPELKEKLDSWIAADLPPAKP